MLPVGIDAPQHGAHLVRRLPVDAVDDQLGITENGVQRRTELMAHVGEELRLVLVRLLELPVHALDEDGLTPLQQQEAQSGGADQREIDQQISEGEQVRGDRLADDHLLDAANVADLPVALRAFRMRVVTADAACLHDDRHDETDAVGEDRSRRVGELPARVGAQFGQRALLERVEVMRRPVLERVVGEEAVADVVLPLAQHAAKLEREGRRNGDRARDELVVVHHLGRSRRREDPVDDVAGVVAANAGDDGVQVGRLAV